MDKGYIYKRRLLALADLLWNLPRGRFDYTKWVGDSWEGMSDLSCGTTACAFGWATTIPSLQRLGLQLYKSDSPHLRARVILKKQRGFVESSDAAFEVFELSDDEYHWLFIPGYFPGHDLTTIGLTNPGPNNRATAKTVAKHIRRFVQHKYNSKR